jgi:hypothetical protein
MGMFSTVWVRDLECPKCHHKGDYDVQFKFGGCNLDDFEIGEALRWGHFDYGEQGHRLVVTTGYDMPCRGCDGPYEPDEVDTCEFDVYIENDVITHVTWHNGVHDYRHDGVADPNSYFIILDDYPPDRDPTAQGSRSVAARNDPSM